MSQPPETYPVKVITEAVDFLQLIKDRFASNPVVRKEFFALLTDFCNGATTDAGAVVTRANGLLQGHPDLVDRFQLFLDPEKEAEQFLERVKHANMNVYDDLLAELLRVDEERGLDAHGVYARFGRVFGSANGDLLRGFAQFLPAKYEPSPRVKAEREGRRPTLKRKHTSDAGVADRSTPTHYPDASYGDAGAAGSSRPSRAKRPRFDDGPTPQCNLVSYAGAGAVWSSWPSRAKNPRADDGENRRAPLGGAANDTGRGTAAPARDDAKDELQRFREAWEFETGYSKLVVTMGRAEELRRELAHGASGTHRRRRASVEELFPSRECREYLAEIYHNAWATMRKLLEDDEYVCFVLEVILNRLRVEEAAVVAEAMSRRDPNRAAQGLDELVQDRVREERERRGTQGQ